MRRVIVLLLSMGIGLLGALVPLAPATALGSPAAPLVGEDPADNTPHVLDGDVQSIAKVGSTMVLGGQFSRARNSSADTELSRTNLLAFDATSGAISSTFLPQPNGPVSAVVPAADGQSVYVAGRFTSIGGVARKNVAKVRVSDGAVDTRFDVGGVSGPVKDLRLTEGRLWLAGAFSWVGGRQQRALATVSATTGAYDTYMDLAVDGTHNGGVTNLFKIDVSPDGRRLVAIGNVLTVAGQTRDQIFMLDLTGPGAALSDFTAPFYEGDCAAVFDSYMRDLDIAPSGDYFVVSTTGAGRGGSSPCDTTARFELDGGAGTAPSWIDTTGGDTTYAVEITAEDVVYVGGHFRWQNNSEGRDRPAPGAVERTGIAALWGPNGLPLSWNPTRTRGVGVFDMLSTPQGLWVGSDTDRIGAYEYHGRIALLPPSSSGDVAAERSTALPNTLYTAGSDAAAGTDENVVARSYRDGQVGQARPLEGSGIDWNAVRGAFMLNGSVYHGTADGDFVRRTFDGSAFGSAVAVDTSDDLTPLVEWHDDVRIARAMAYDFGRVYYTRAGSNQLFYRYLAAQSDVVGARRYVASASLPGLDFSQVQGMVITNDTLLFANRDGRLFEADWAQGGASGAPVPGTVRQVSGPGVDAQDWNARALFAFQDDRGRGAGAGDVAPQPTSSFEVSCTDLTCEVDGSGSSVDGGEIASYDWDFGDGASATGARASHTYDEAGTWTATLTVTTTDGASDTSSRSFSLEAPPEPEQGAVAFVGSASSAGNRRNHTVDVPQTARAGDTLVAFYTVNSPDAAITAPAGWTRLQSVDGNRVQGVAWSRTATAADAGRTISVSTGVFAKSALSLAVYRGVDGPSAVGTSAVALENPSGTEHRTPAVEVTVPGSWLVSYWSEKSADSPSWSLPASVDLHESPSSAGAGAISARLGDSRGQVPTGQAGPLVASTSTSVARAVMFSVVIQPEETVANRAPQASFSVQCPALRCTFDASGSTDPDDDTLSYAWDFGDGSTGTGVSPAHTYDSAGERTVTLTVSDGDATDRATRQASPSEVEAAAPVTFVGSASSAGNRRDHEVRIPASVQAGDTLLAFYSVNSPDAAIAAPAGWTRLQGVDGNKVQGVAWTRTATATDTGALVSVRTDVFAKSALAVSAYRAAGAGGGVTASAVALENPSGTDHVTPTVEADAEGQWLVSVWTEKSAGSHEWVLPGGVTQREAAQAQGGGAISLRLTDSAGSVAPGTVGGLTATTPESVSRAIMFSVLVGAS